MSWKNYILFFFLCRDRYVYRYRLEPSLDSVVRFPSVPRSYPEPPARDCDNVLHKVFLKLRPLVVPASASSAPSSATTKQQRETAASSTKQLALAPLIPVAAPTVIRDFFGRIVAVQEDAPKKEAEPSDQLAPATVEKPVLRFKFNAGFTNAVRRTVFMKDFL